MMLETLIPILQATLRENGNIDVQLRVVTRENTGELLNPEIGEPVVRDDDNYNRNLTIGALTVEPLTPENVILPEGERPTLFLTATEDGAAASGVASNLEA